MDRAQMRVALDDAFDQGLVFHSYTDTMRDYQAVVEKSAAPSTGIPTVLDRYLFTVCVEAITCSVLSAEIWQRSAFDDRLLDGVLAEELDLDLGGFVWGVRQQTAYPGFALVEDSPRARHWKQQLGIPFHEVTFTGDAHTVSLVFNDLRVEKLAPDWSPFRVSGN